MERFIGIDVGAETIKIAEVVLDNTTLSLTRHELIPHGKRPADTISEVLPLWNWTSVSSAVATGRLGRQLALSRIPTKQALVEGFRFIHGSEPATVVNIGSRGLSVLELRAAGEAVYRESSRCAQGTGNFLRQLVERFGLDVDAAAAMSEPVTDPAQLSGRCPVILKTDMTHLANKGERHERILAGLFDAIAESAEVLVKPRRSPPRVLLTGGVSRARRVRQHFSAFLERHGMHLLDSDGEAAMVLEAIGCAVYAARMRPPTPVLADLVAPAEHTQIEMLPPLRTGLTRVRRMVPQQTDACVRKEVSAHHSVALGFDIGSTGSKLVAVGLASGEPVWEGYVCTGGDPVGAAQRLMRMFLDDAAGTSKVRLIGVTGSGREIVGSLLTICFGADPVFVLNEIAAHARGACHYDPRVDTIFEIGGQDAKYIRLDGGRVVDAAMNEACSAGTGSFIEEQGRWFEGVPDVMRLSDIALGSDASAALGQHCSIFMAEVIDEATAAGVPRDRIVAGLFEAVIQNYLHRVKGSRSVGDVIFCQGMPFASDALAAAVARQTGCEVLVPPNPGTVGALGIALLARDALAVPTSVALDTRRFLDVRVEAEDTFVCGSIAGCGGAGNKCRIDRLTTCFGRERRRFTWGGSCSLYDRGTRTRKAPDGAPNPFRERTQLVAAIAQRLSTRRGGRRIALSDDLQLKGFFPFFARFLYELGQDLDVAAHAGRDALKRGIEASNVPWCAPMQQYHGAVAALAERDADLVFVPMIREIPRVATERASQLCPVVQASADVLRWDLGAAVRGRILSPVIDVGGGALESPVFLESCRRLAVDLGCEGAWRRAFAAARAEQLTFDSLLLDFGRSALERCARDKVIPVIVLGRTYTIHDDVLNSNLPAILRDQGAIAIPLDCYPVREDTPLFENMYWGHGQRILRAAWQIRRAPGIYAILASNYSCGPDSFTHPFVQDAMEGKPFAVIETDGHAGDAGTKTRVEAFLHCVREHRADSRCANAPHAAERLTVRSATLSDVASAGERVLIPTMSDAAEVFGAALRGIGLDAEVLPEPGPTALRLGRRHTSGKECLPMVLTLGSLLERLERERNGTDRFAFVMPSTDGPCRFGAYKEMHQLVLNRLGFADRVRIWSPPFGDYFQGIAPGLGAIVLAGVVSMDVLRDLRHDVRPRQKPTGDADAIYRHYLAAVVRLVERESAGNLSGTCAVREAATGHVWGLPGLLARASADFAEIRGRVDLPLVLVTGEIYLRNVASSNGGVLDALERRGIRARVSPVSELLQYSDFIGFHLARWTVARRVDSWVRRRIQVACHTAAAAPMGWPVPPHVKRIISAAGPWVRDALEGETVLTIGASVHAWRSGEIDGVLVVGPLECMPNKVAETQLVHIGEQEALLSLTLSLNGDPIDPEMLDAFALAVHARHLARTGAQNVRRFPKENPVVFKAIKDKARQELGLVKDGIAV